MVVIYSQMKYNVITNKKKINNAIINAKNILKGKLTMTKKTNKFMGQITIAAIATAVAVTAVPAISQAESLSYSRDYATKIQKDIIANDKNDEFVKHLFKTIEGQSATSNQELANVLAESIGKNEAAIVIKDDNKIFGNLVSKKTNLVEEIEKQGSNKGALVSGYSIANKVDSKGNSTWVFIPYYEETEALSSAKGQFIDQVAKHVGQNYSSDIERLGAIYSYLAQTTVYDENTNIVSSSPASLILENKAICEAFAYLYGEIAQKLGINTKYVTGVVERNGERFGHAWNLVEINNKWYNSDATWGNIDRDNKDGLEVNMSYFLFSDEIANQNYTRDHNTLPKANDKTYDVLHNNVNIAYGGGVTDELIVSPTTSEIIVYNYITNTVVSLPIQTNEYKILNSALVGKDLYVKTQVFGSYSGKIQKLNVVTGEFNDVSDVNLYAPVNFEKNGIFSNGSLVASYDSDASIISKNLNVNINLQGKNEFALQTAYTKFAQSPDSEILSSIEQYYATIDLNNIEASKLSQDLSVLIEKLKDSNAKAAQKVKLADYTNFLNISKEISSATTEAQLNELKLIANTITDEQLKSTALELINTKQGEVIPTEPDEDNNENDVPTTPPNEDVNEGETPIEPTIPPATGGNGDEVPTESTTPPVTDENEEEVEIVKPVTPPATGEVNPVTPPAPGDVKPVTPPTVVEPTKPVTPPTIVEPVKPVTPPTVVEPTKPVTPPTIIEPSRPVTPPTIFEPTFPTTPSTIGDNGNQSSGFINWNFNPRTKNETVKFENTPNVKDTPKVEDTPEITVNEGLSGVTIKLPSFLMGTNAVELDVNRRGNIIIKTSALDNTTAATVSIPMSYKDNGQVLKVITESGLETIPYTVKNGLIIVQANKAGELVFLDSDATVRDISKSQYKQSIQKLLTRGIFTGDNSLFNPKNNMTRAQFAGTLSRALGLNEVSPTGLKGVSGNAWYAGHAGALADLGIMGEYGKNFNPSKDITREEMFSAVGKLLKLKGVTSNINIDGKFVDTKNLSNDSKVAIAVLVEIGAVSGDNGKLNPKDSITKGQMAKVLDKVLTQLELL